VGGEETLRDSILGEEKEKKTTKNKGKGKRRKWREIKTETKQATVD
jgi:hypothetical protein